LCLLALADLRATYEQTLPQDLWAASLDVCRTLLENFWEKPAESILPAPYLDGNDLIKELKLQPGYRVGYLLEKVREAQASGKLASRARALKYAREVQAQMDRAEIMEYIQIDGVRIAFFQRPGTGTPVVLLHGFPFDHTIWQSVIPFLPPDAWLILPDLRGHGQSAAPPGIYSMSRLADDVAAILGYLRVRKAILVGHSMGGYVALAYARGYPKYLAGLGLVASRADADSPEGRAARYKLVDEIPERGLSVLADAMLPKLTTDEGLAAKLRDVILGAKVDGVLGVLQGMAERPDSSSLLADLKVPLMAVLGGQDKLIPREQAQRLGTLAPGLKMVEVPDAGHMPMMESPESTAKAILQLMSEVK
jgi:pimeloyl-ACP methyl ester carboxylesterase